MQFLFIFFLSLFGLLFGSFASVIIYRIKSGEGGILTGRSHCNSCNNILPGRDLIPLFSWLFTLGKCRQCKSHIPIIYPILELSTAFLFACVGYFFINSSLLFAGDTGEILQLGLWLSLSFITILYVFYDILFLEISEGILASGIGISLIGILIQSYVPLEIFPSLPSYIPGYISAVHISVFILLLTLFSLYTIILGQLSHIIDGIILLFLIGLISAFHFFITDIVTIYSPTDFPAISASIGILLFFIFFYLQIIISQGRWMGGGDLRIGILVGLLLGHSLSLAGMMLTYFSGSIIGIGLIIYQKITYKGKKLNSAVPFGPFIALGFFLSVFFQTPILDFITRMFYF